MVTPPLPAVTGEPEASTHPPGDGSAQPHPQLPTLRPGRRPHSASAIAKAGKFTITIGGGAPAGGLKIGWFVLS